jgi:hypothetical protein
MPLLAFKKQFWEKVMDGSKPHTIRKKRKWPIAAGDRVVLYTSPLTRKADDHLIVRCRKAQSIEIHRQQEGLKFELGVIIFIDGVVQSAADAVELIHRDGFGTVDEFIQWFLPA